MTLTPADRRQLWQSGIAGLAIAVTWWALSGGHRVIGGVACAVAIGLTIVEPGRRAIRALRKRVLSINVLMVIAVAGALILGDYVEAAAVIWLFGIAEWLEGRSLERARHAIRALMTLAPPVALVRRRDGERSMPIEQVVVGDAVIVRPGERVPVDGEVVSGMSAVDQAPITGESWPVDKGPGDEVFAGTINGNGALELLVRRPASDSTLAHIIRLVEEAQKRRAPIQTFVDRFSQRYTPAVTVLAILVAIVPPFVLGGVSGWTSELSVWGYRALALLVVACPCALVISTPVAIVSALTAAARHGVLIKGGSHLERLSEIRCVAFDKTGTLTHGAVSVSEVLALEGVSNHGVLSVAASLEVRSEHPIARAIVHEARAAGVIVAPGDGFRALPGLGAEATVDDAYAIVGSHRLFEERQLCTPALHAHVDDLMERGATPVLVSRNGSALGVIGLTDLVREGGRDVITALRKEGIQRIALLTGDTRATAAALVVATGIDEVHAELLPQDKVRHVEQLRSRFGPVMMVGDGVNDAPALAAADVGVAMGVAGTGVALETADVALMSDDLGKLPYALRLSHATMRNVRTNVAIALGLKLAFVALAAMGLATLWMAVLADTGASLIVTANSLRLLREKS
jgi:Cd2+/Zn2+-exporting ATPase